MFMKIIFFYIISGGGGGHTLQKSKSGKELGLIEVNAPIYPVDTKHTFPPGRIFLIAEHSRMVSEKAT